MRSKNLLLVISLLANGFFIARQYALHHTERMNRDRLAERYLRNLGAAEFYLAHGLQFYREGKAESAAYELYTATDGLEIAKTHLVDYLHITTKDVETLPDYIALPHVFDLYTDHVHRSVHSLYQQEDLSSDDLERLQVIHHDVRVLLDVYSLELLVENGQHMVTGTEIVCQRLQDDYPRRVLCGHE